MSEEAPVWSMVGASFSIITVKRPALQKILLIRQDDRCFVSQVCSMLMKKIFEFVFGLMAFSPTPVAHNAGSFTAMIGNSLRCFSASDLIKAYAECLLKRFRDKLICIVLFKPTVFDAYSPFRLLFSYDNPQCLGSPSDRPCHFFDSRASCLSFSIVFHLIFLW